MFAMFRVFSMVRAVAAFIQSPTGRPLIGGAGSFVGRGLEWRRADRAAALPAGRV